VHSIIYTQHNPRGIRVMESLDEILELSKK
jgi:hypothetical protein